MNTNKYMSISKTCLSWLTIILATLAITIGVSFVLLIPPPISPIVIQNGCSYYEIYHSRRSQHYEYVHCQFCTNSQHYLTYIEGNQNEN